jgi:molecular chaperone DnaK
MGKSIGIDLGTTNSVVAFKEMNVKIIKHEGKLEELVRSCVTFHDGNNDPYVGKIAYRSFDRYLPNSVISVKRLMGGSINDDGVKMMMNDKDSYPFNIKNLSTGTDDAVAIVIHGKELTPEEISSFILKRLKDQASEELGDVTHAVITVPAYFNAKQKMATRLAAHKAGLKVQRLLSEPTAAAISYGIDNMKSGESKVLLVYDFGGGTFDLSILIASEGKFIESVTSGDRWLGGDDIDKLLRNWFIQQICNKYKINDFNESLMNLKKSDRDKFNVEFRLQIEEIKKQLSSSKSAQLYLPGYLEDETDDIIDIDIKIEREDFESLIYPLVKRTIELTDKLLEENSYPIETIDNILLVGGSSCIPLVKRMLIDKYGTDKVVVSDKPMLAIAEGAAILAHSLTEEFECPICGTLAQKNQTQCDNCKANIEEITIGGPENDMVVHTTTHNYFLQITDNNGHKKLEKIIDNATPLPTSSNKNFKTTVNNQKLVEILIYADAENGTFDRQSRGYYLISENLPSNSDLTFTFSMDADQTLQVKAYPRGRNDLAHGIVLSKGNKDGKCLQILSEVIEQIYTARDISDNKKVEFTESIQNIIEEINKIGNGQPDDNKWYELECKIIQSKELAYTTEENKELPFIFAQILLNVFSSHLDNTDKIDLRDLTSRYEGSTNDLQRQGLLNEMKEITDNYLIFIHVFMLKLSADQAEDHNSARQLNDNYNSALAALGNGDVSQAISVLQNSEQLLEQNPIDFSKEIKN